MALMIISCISNNIRDYHELSFIPEIYPYTDTVYSNHFNETSFYKFGEQHKYKLLFYVSGDCSVCFAQIPKWQKYVSDNNEILNKVAKAIVIQTEQLQMLEYNLERINSSLPIYIDTANILFTYNNIPDRKSVFSILLNEDNEVIEYDVEKLKKNRLAKLLNKIVH